MLFYFVDKNLQRLFCYYFVDTKIDRFFKHRTQSTIGMPPQLQTIDPLNIEYVLRRM